MPMWLLCSWPSTCFCNSSFIMTCLPFIIIPSFTARSSTNVQYGLISSVISFVCTDHLCMMYSFSHHVFVSRVFLAVYLVPTCILGCLLLCVCNQCLPSFWLFLHLCSLQIFVMTISLLWIGPIQACILSWFCNGKFSVVCIEVSAMVWLHPSWRSLLVTCDPCLHLPLQKQ